MMMDEDQVASWKAHIDQYAKCPACGADGELEGTSDVVDPEKPGEPVTLRERMDCPACHCTWWERWIYAGPERAEH